MLCVSALCSGMSAQSEDSGFETAAEAVRNMRVGWNLGNTLDSNSGDTLNMWIEADKNRTTVNYETAWGQKVTKSSLMRMLKEAGFNAVRVPVTWYPHMEAKFTSVKGYTDPSDGKWKYTPWCPSKDDIGTKIDRKWMARVRQVVDYVVGQGMYCILNVHHDTGASNTAWLVADEECYRQQRERFEAVWRQIAEEFKDYDEHLLFEGYNEMLDAKRSWCFASFATEKGYDSKVAASAYKAINSYAQSFVDAVRSTGGRNAQRNLVLCTYGACDGSGLWNSHLLDPLKEMKLPEDEVENHLLFEVHSYPDVKSLPDAKKHVDALMRNLDNYLAKKGAPVIVGEWGTSTENAYGNFRANLLGYSTYMVRKAKEHGVATFHWMGLTDGASRTVPKFDQADLKDALIKGYYGEEGYQTGVDAPIVLSVSTDETELSSQAVYTVGGAKVDGRPLSPGFYVEGGKKVLVH